MATNQTHATGNDTQESHGLMPYSRLITPELRDSLIENNKSNEEDSLIIAHWVSLSGGFDHYGISISPERPSVVWGCVPESQYSPRYLDFGTWWIQREDGNPFSYGNALDEQLTEVYLNGEPWRIPFFNLDTNWKPIRVSELRKSLEMN